MITSATKKSELLWVITGRNNLVCGKPNFTRADVELLSQQLGVRFMRAAALNLLKAKVIERNDSGGFCLTTKGQTCVLPLDRQSWNFDECVIVRTAGGQELVFHYD
jgi:hypothetical protein